MYWKGLSLWVLGYSLAASLKWALDLIRLSRAGPAGLCDTVSLVPEKG
jgi:hypothetical protein